MEASLYIIAGGSILIALILFWRAMLWIWKFPKMKIYEQMSGVRKTKNREKR